MHSHFRTLVGLLVGVALFLPACTKTYTKEDLHRIDREQARKEQDALNSARRTEELGGPSVEGMDEAMIEAEMESER